MSHPADPAARYLPAGFPLPEPEVMGRLRETILKETRTPHPPEPAELAAAIAADEAGVDLAGIDAGELWLRPASERAGVFQALRRVLGALAEG